MVTTPIFDPSIGHKMRVALFISGSGTNGLRIIDKSKEDKSNFEVTLIFSDIKDTRSRRNGSKMSRAKEISEKYGIAYECVDIRDFYKERGLKRTDLSIRHDYDRLVLEMLRGYDIDLIVNAGYMSIMRGGWLTFTPLTSRLWTGIDGSTLVYMLLRTLSSQVTRKYFQPLILCGRRLMGERCS